MTGSNYYENYLRLSIVLIKLRFVAVLFVIGFMDCYAQGVQDPTSRGRTANVQYIYNINQLISSPVEYPIEGTSTRETNRGRHPSRISKKIGYLLL